MTTERFDIEVQDKVAKSIRTELTAIGTAATSTFSAVKAMKAELAGMSGANTSARAMAAGIRDQARASNEASRAARAEAASIQTVTDALQAQARAARDLASARGSVGPAPPAGSRPSPLSPGGGAAGAGVAGAAAAAGGAMRSAAMDSRALGAANALNAQHSANLVFQLNDIAVSLASGQKPWMVAIQQGSQISQIQMQAGISYKQMAISMLDMLRITRTVTAAEEAAALATAASTAARVGNISAAAAANVVALETEIALATAQQRLAVTATEAAAAQTRLTAATVGLATAQAEAAAATAVNSEAQLELSAATEAANAKTVRSMTRFGRGGVAAIAIMIASLIGAKMASDELNESVSKNDLTEGLGLTAKEIKKLEDVSITMGDVVKGVFLSLGDAIPQPIKDAMQDVQDLIDEAWNWSVTKTKEAANYIIGSMIGAYRTIVKVWGKLPEAMGDLFFSAVNMSIEAVNALVKASVDGINGFMAEAEKAIGLDLFGELSTPQIDKVKNEYAGAAREVGAVAAAEMKKALAVDYIGDAASYVKNRIVGVARDRLKDQAKDIIDDRSEKAAKKAKKAREEEDKRAKAMADVNRELDTQIELLGYYGEALERETQFVAIRNSLAQKGIELSEREEKSIRAKIALIQEGKRVQSELTRLEEEANGPGRAYAATIAAITIALADNVIGEEEAERQRILAANKLKRDSNPLFDYVKELHRAEIALGVYGRQLEVVTRAQALFDKAVETGRNRKDDTARDYEAEAEKEVRGEEINDVFQDIDPRERAQDINSFILDNHAEMYAKINELRQADLISEEEASIRKRNLDAALGDARLEAASTVFGQLSTLQNSENRKVAAIGKAAAIAQATIDGYRAVQAALAGPPGPPWSYAIAAATGVAAAANVAKIAGVGFEGGGHTGVGSNNETAGMVHRNEFVMDAVTTRNIGVPALEAMRRGARLSGAPANDNRGASRVVVHQHAGTIVEERRTSDGEIELIARRVARDEAPKAVARDMMSGANSSTSKAVATSFGVKRNR